MDAKSDLFANRDRFRQARTWGGVLHLASVALAVIVLVLAYPRTIERSIASRDQETRATEVRRALIEALDRVVRYEHYHHEVYGRFTRDLYRLGLPEKLSDTTLDEIRRYFEISVIESSPSHVLVAATGLGFSARELSLTGDRVIIDEHFRVQASFPLPEPSRSYLLEEADRKIRHQLQGKGHYEGVYADYWKVERAKDTEAGIVAVGKRAPVLGEIHSWIEPVGAREISSVARPEIFQSVRDRLRSRVLPAESSEKSTPYVRDFRADDVRAWLEQVRLAQHIYRREFGRYARRWEDLAAVSDILTPNGSGFAPNLRVLPIEVSGREQVYRVTVEGKVGDLLGEQFVLDNTGAVRQLRYSDALAHQLQESTKMLKDTLNFKIEELPESVDTPKSGLVK